MQLRKLQSIELLTTEKVWLLDQNLSLRKLHKLRLSILLEVLDRADRLIVDRLTLSVTRLEWLGSSLLVHLEITHVATLGVLIVIGISPVTLKVARTSTTMPLAVATS